MGNIDADSGLTWFPDRTLSDPSREHFIFENDLKFREYDRISFFDKSADMAEFHEKMLGKVVYGSHRPESMI